MEIDNRERFKMRDIYKIKNHPECHRDAVVQGSNYRFTVLTSRLIRLEYNNKGLFEDRVTQTVLNRNFPVPQFQVIDKENSLEIITDNVHMIYNKGKFTKIGLSFQVRGNVTNYHSIWNFGEETTDLKGTTRTLDHADGKIPLEHGLISKNGFSVIDDSHSLIISEDGWVVPRDEETIDFYFLGYGHRYQECLKDFYTLCGKTPLLPRYTLGNWWSRYHKYTETEYKELMKRFEKEQIPFSVAVIDMDWHLVDIDPKFGSGWTGYTWNKDFFPDPEGFMNWLHENHMKITLNVHPADGVRSFEDNYIKMAKALGINYKEREKINFDITDEKFLDAYFQYLHNPLEDEGVDFWWIDWQSGNLSKIPRLDPLWMLNHYHYLDSKRRGTRQLIFSRYSGFGSHRYPIGFSGDTVISWESFDFQPYFTANASNAGYGWWSHDIGGHMHGYKDDELCTRWIQFGVFSPIMRLHSTDNSFNGKEPWNYNKISELAIKKYLKLRHELIPYLYTMNRYASREGKPLLRPMYYLEPEQPETYEVPNEYYFGTELITCPITKPIDKRASVAKVNAWIPKGIWFDFFKGRIYTGNRMISLYRGIEDIPVLAKAGAIIPMADLTEYTNQVNNPEALEVRIFAGDNGQFHLYEDFGDTVEDLDENWSDTIMSFNWSENPEFIIGSPKGNISVLPKKRSFKLKFYGITNNNILLKINDIEVESSVIYDDKMHLLTVHIPKVDILNKITIRFLNKTEVANNNIVSEAYEFLHNCQIEYDLKSNIYNYIKEAPNSISAISSLAALNLEPTIFGALCEILSAKY